MKMKSSLMLLVAVAIIPVLTYAAVSQSASSIASIPLTTDRVQKASVPAVALPVVALATTPKPKAVSPAPVVSTKETPPVPVAPATSANTSYNSLTTRPIQVSSTNPYFTVSLPRNTSTGYMWYLKSYDSRFVLLLRHNIQGSKNSVVGVPGNEVWQFSVNPRAFIAPHMTMLQFEYARPWNLNDHPSVVDFTVVTQ